MPASNSSETPATETGSLSNAMTIFMTGAEQFQWSFLRGAVWETVLLTSAISG